MASSDTYYTHPSLERQHPGSTTTHGNEPVYLNTYTRTDHNTRHYVGTNKGGPKWSEVIRR
eukprot:5300124-Pyramimonas_sp.AAC.1